MKTLELQTQIIRKVLDTTDPVLLDFVNSVLAGKENEAVYKLTDEEKRVVRDSLADYEAGNTVSHEDVMKRFDKWLEE